MDEYESAQIQILIKMKHSRKFFGELIAQEFEMESSTIGNKFLSWNASILQPIPKNKDSLDCRELEWTEKDIAQNLTGLQRDATYEFTIRVITQMSSSRGAGSFSKLSLTTFIKLSENLGIS